MSVSVCVCLGGGRGGEEEGGSESQARKSRVETMRRRVSTFYDDKARG